MTKNDKKWLLYVLCWIMHELCWDGGKFGPPESLLAWWPQRFLFFLNGIIIVHEIKAKKKSFRCQIF